MGAGVREEKPGGFGPAAASTRGRLERTVAAHVRGPGPEIGNYKMGIEAGQLWPPEGATRQVALPAARTVPLSQPRPENHCWERVQIPSWGLFRDAFEAQSLFPFFLKKTGVKQ